MRETTPQALHIASEVATHIFCAIVPIFWVLLPLTTAPSQGIVYGDSGRWCWIRRDRMGNIWHLAALYIPMWVMNAVIVALYACCLLFVFISYHRLHMYEMRGIQNSNIFAKFSHQMFLIVRSEKEDKLLIRLTTEWKIYANLVLYPAAFLFVWLFPTINRVLQISGKTHISMELIHAFVVSLQGFFYVLIYPINPIKMLLWMRRLPTCG